MCIRDRAYGAQQDVGDGAQGAVACSVAEAIVVAREMVEVAEQQSQRVADLRGASHLLTETRLEVPLVVELGEAVGDGVHTRSSKTGRALGPTIVESAWSCPAMLL